MITHMDIKRINVDICGKQLYNAMEGVERRSCWNYVRDYDPSLFNICIDCLVYLTMGTNRINTSISENELSRILANRQEMGLKVNDCTLSRPLFIAETMNQDKMLSGNDSC